MTLNEALLSLDLASLRTFVLVYRLRSFSAAADNIDVKQSTVSYTIDRLRRVVDDPLFLRQGGKIVPTDRCREVLNIAERILSEAEGLLSDDKFDPAQSKAEVRVTCASYAMSVLIPPVIRRIRIESPDMKFDVKVGYLNHAEMLLEGQTDLAIFTSDIDVNGIYSTTLIDNDYDVCVMAPDNPLAGKTLTEQDIVEANFMLARPYPGFRHFFAIEAEKRGLPINAPVSLTLPDDVPLAVHGTDLISAMPSRMARLMADQLAFARFPYETRIPLNMFWSAASHRSKINTWLRNVFIEEAAALPPPMSV